MKHYQCFLRRHSDGGRVLIIKISFIVIGVFGFLVFISFVIACVGIEIQFGKRIEQKGPKMVIPDWIHQKEVEFVSGKNKLKGYIFWNAKDNKLSEKIIVLVHGYGVTYKDYEIEIEEFVKRKYSVFAYDMTGCGMSQGKKIGGFSQFLLDAQSAIKYVESMNLNMEIELVGHSTGAYAVAALLNFDNLGVSKSIIISGFNHPSSYVSSCLQKTIKGLSYLVQVWIYIMGIVKYGEIAKYTGVDGINHFQGEILVMQNERDDMVTLKQSLYSNRSKIINRKVLFWLKNDAGHYPTRKKINGKEIAEDATFEVIKNFLE